LPEITLYSLPVAVYIHDVRNRHGPAPAAGPQESYCGPRVNHRGRCLFEWGGGCNCANGAIGRSQNNPAIAAALMTQIRQTSASGPHLAAGRSTGAKRGYWYFIAGLRSFKGLCDRAMPSPPNICKHWCCQRLISRPALAAHKNRT